MLLQKVSSKTGHQHVISEVAESYRAGRLLVFAGSGISEAAGLPSRTDLVEALSERCTDIDIDKLRADEVASLAQRAQWSDALAELRDGMGRNEFAYWLERCLDDSGAEIPAIARDIARMAPRLRAVLTTNMDFVLDRAFGGAWASFAGVTRDIPQRQHYILKLRGMLSDRATWIVTRDDYDQAFNDTQRHDVLTSLYHTYQILFVCHDFADRDIEQIIDKVGASGSLQPPRHVALVPAGMVIHPRKSVLAAAGIRVIELGVLDDGYAEISELLRAVSDEARESSPWPEAALASGFEPIEVSPHKALQTESSCPYPGLACLDEQNAEVFFGREADVSAALQLLGDTRAGHKRWLFIDGASGVGKSSLIQAGILPKVRHGHLVGTHKDWLVAVMRPGAEPVWNLAHIVFRTLHSHLPCKTDLDYLVSEFHRSETALANYLRQCTPAGHGLFLVIDQLEEAVTLASDGKRRAFDALLACALSDKAGPLYLATTVRADFAAHMADLPLLETLLNREASRFYLKAMSVPGLRAAIVEPARRAGLIWDDHLVDRILCDAADSDGSLPLVAHVLQALWLERDGHRLTHGAYESLGRVSGALTRSADAIVYSLSEDERALARALLLCLVAVGPRDTYTRRPITRSKALRAAGGGKRAENILARLSGGRDPDKPGNTGSSCARLLAVTQCEEHHRVDLVHEALLDQWASLAAWLDESRKELLLHDDLKARLDSWRRSGSSPRNLPADAELEYLLAARHLADDDEGDFLAMAEAKQSRARFRIKALIVFLLLVVAGVSWLAIYAFSQGDEAKRQAVVAQKKADEVEENAARLQARDAELAEAESKYRAAQRRTAQATQEAERAEADRRKAEARRERAERAAANAEAEQTHAVAQRNGALREWQRAKQLQAEAEQARKEAELAQLAAEKTQRQVEERLKQQAKIKADYLERKFGLSSEPPKE